MSEGIEPGPRHIVLVGLPGSGKTTVGRAAAKQLHRAFIDFDEEIERREGMSVAEIFRLAGERQFRQLERQLTEELRFATGKVLAPGGGWITNRENVDAMRAVALLVYLRVDPGTALRRMGRTASKRPLLGEESPLARLESLLEQRRAAYESADVTIDTEGQSPDQVVKELIRLAG